MFFGVYRPCTAMVPTSSQTFIYVNVSDNRGTPSPRPSSMLSLMECLKNQNDTRNKKNSKHRIWCTIVISTHFRGWTSSVYRLCLFFFRSSMPSVEAARRHFTPIATTAVTTTPIEKTGV